LTNRGNAGSALGNSHSISNNGNNMNSSNSIASHNVIASERRHHANSIDPHTKGKEQIQRKDIIKDLTIIAVSQAPVSNSLKNSKNNNTTQHSSKIV
jgi:hypothetical protein